MSGGAVKSICHSSLSDFQPALYISDGSKYMWFNSITFTFRLVITCTEDLLKDSHDLQTARNSISRGVSGMYGDSTFADFIFIAGGREFKVHRNILATASPVMQGMFTSGLAEAKTKKCVIDAISPETFDLMMRFIYCGEVPKGVRGFPKPLYEAAHYYEIENL